MGVFWVGEGVRNEANFGVWGLESVACGGLQEGVEALAFNAEARRFGDYAEFIESLVRWRSSKATAE